MSSVLERAGLPAPAPGDRARRSVRALVEWVADHGQWVIEPARAAKLVKAGSLAQWAGAAREIRPGDVIALRASRIPGDWCGHVALVVGASEHAGARRRQRGPTGEAEHSGRHGMTVAPCWWAGRHRPS